MLSIVFKGIVLLFGWHPGEPVKAAYFLLTPDHAHVR